MKNATQAGHTQRARNPFRVFLLPFPWLMVSDRIPALQRQTRIATNRYFALPLLRARGELFVRLVERRSRRAFGFGQLP
jgi:hypothetical protein